MDTTTQLATAIVTVQKGHGLGDQQPSANEKIPARAMSLCHPDYPHGTLHGYRCCSCVACKGAQSAYRRERNATKPKGINGRKRVAMGLDPSDPAYPHGTSSGYRYCKCDSCRQHNTDRKRDLNAKYRQTPEHKALVARLSREYSKTEQGRASRNASNAARKASMLMSHLPLDERELIKRIYALCPEGFQVDHIAPISKGGKHVSTNLQYLPDAINNAKRAKLDFDVSAHVVRWQELIGEGSTTIPQGSRAKRPEVRGDQS